MPRSLYTRRPNPDGTTDSICNKCFITVVTAIGEVELDRAETRHICDPALLEYWKAMRDEKQRESDRRTLRQCSSAKAA